MVNLIFKKENNSISVSNKNGTYSFYISENFNKLLFLINDLFNNNENIIDSKNFQKFLYNLNKNEENNNLSLNMEYIERLTNETTVNIDEIKNLESILNDNDLKSFELDNSKFNNKIYEYNRKTIKYSVSNNQNNDSRYRDCLYCPTGIYDTKTGLCDNRDNHWRYR